MFWTVSVHVFLYFNVLRELFALAEKERCASKSDPKTKHLYILGWKELHKSSDIQKQN